MNITLDNFLYLFQIITDNLINSKLLLFRLKEKKNGDLLPPVLSLFFIITILLQSISFYSQYNNYLEMPSLSIYIIEAITTLFVIFILCSLYIIFEGKNYIREFALLSFLTISIFKIVGLGLFFLYLSTEIFIFIIIYGLLIPVYLFYLLYWFYRVAFNSKFISKISYSLISLLSILLISNLFNYKADYSLTEEMDIPGDELFKFIKNERSFKKIPLLFLEIVKNIEPQENKIENYYYNKDEEKNLELIWNSYYTEFEIKSNIKELEESRKIKYKFKSSSILLHRKIKVYESILRLNNMFRNKNPNLKIELKKLHNLIFDYKYSVCQYESLIVTKLQSRRFWSDFSLISLVNFHEIYKNSYNELNEPITTVILPTGETFEKNVCNRNIWFSSYSKGKPIK